MNKLIIENNCRHFNLIKLVDQEKYKAFLAFHSFSAACEYKKVWLLDGI